MIFFTTAFLLIVSLTSSVSYGAGQFHVDPVIRSSSPKVGGFIHSGVTTRVLSASEDGVDGVRKFDFEVDSDQIGGLFEVTLNNSKTTALFGQLSHIKFNRYNEQTMLSLGGSGYSVGLGIKSILFSNRRSSFSLLASLSTTNWVLKHKELGDRTGGLMESSITAQLQSQNLNLATYYNHRATKKLTIYGGFEFSPYGRGTLNVKGRDIYYDSFSQTTSTDNIDESDPISLTRDPSLTSGIQYIQNRMSYGAKVNLTNGASITLSVGKYL